MALAMRTFGCKVLVGFLGLRNKLEHLQWSVFVVKGDPKTIARVGGHVVDCRVSSGVLNKFCQATPRAHYKFKLTPIMDAYLAAFHAVSKSTTPTCAVVPALELVEPFGHVPRMAMLTLRDTILARVFGTKIAFECSDKLMFRKFQVEHNEMLEDVLNY